MQTVRLLNTHCITSLPLYFHDHSRVPIHARHTRVRKLIWILLLKHLRKIWSCWIFESTYTHFKHQVSASIFSHLRMRMYSINDFIELRTRITKQYYVYYHASLDVFHLDWNYFYAFLSNLYYHALPRSSQTLLTC